MTAPTPVPFVDLRRAQAPLKDELRAAFERVIGHAGYVLGKEVATFEAALCAYTGHEHAVGVSSGTDALLATFLALDYLPGSEVITTPFTFISTASSVLRAGLSPVFADLGPDSFAPDKSAIERCITPATKAVLVVHLYGEPLELQAIKALCDEHGLDLIEDCAQAIGARHADGAHVGTVGRAGTLSFFPAKNLGALGDGGAVLTNDAELAKRVTAIRQHGCTIKYRYDRLGGNFRLDALQAAMLSVLLAHLDGWIAERARNADRYRQLLKPAKSLILPVAQLGHCHNQFVLRTPQRDTVAAALQAAQIGHAIYYPHPLHTQPMFCADGPAPSLPNAEQRCTEVLALPIAPGLTDTELQRVAQVVNAALIL